MEIRILDLDDLARQAGKHPIGRVAIVAGPDQSRLTSLAKEAFPNAKVTNEDVDG